MAGSVSDAVQKMRTYAVEVGFALVETDRAYTLAKMRGSAAKIHSGSRFWGRKQLDNTGANAIELTGEASLESGNAVVRVQFTELHGKREHTFAGSRALEACVDRFCELWTAWI